MITIKHASQVFLEGLSVYAPSGLSVCLEEDQYHRDDYIRFDCIYNLWDDVWLSKAITFTMELLFDDQEGVIEMYGLQQGEFFALSVASYHAGYKTVQDLWDAGLQVKVQEWSGHKPTWLVSLRPDIAMAIMKLNADEALKNISLRP